MVKQKYSQTRIQLLYQTLLNSQQQGSPRQYDIRVDDLKVVERTSDPEHFFSHTEFILPDTQSVTITLYEGSSNRCSRHVLLLEDEKPKERGKEDAIVPTLAGIEQIMEEKMSKEKLQWKLERSEEKNTELQERLDDAEEYMEGQEKQIAQLQQQVIEERQRKFQTNKDIGAVLSGLADGLIRSNTSLLKRIPGGEALAGLIEADNSQRLNDAADEHTTSASFSKKQATIENSNTGKMDEKQAGNTGLDPRTIFYMKQLEVLASEEQREQFNNLLALFATEPGWIDHLWGYLETTFQQQETGKAEQAASPAGASTGTEGSSVEDSTDDLSEKLM